MQDEYKICWGLGWKEGIVSFASFWLICFLCWRVQFVLVFTVTAVEMGITMHSYSKKKWHTKVKEF